MKANRFAGVPYTDEQIAHAREDLLAQRDPNADSAGLLKRYPKANVVAGEGSRPTEMDALVAYLQMLGTLVNFADTNTERLQQ
jgi:cytochrome c oxidase cbb3-type subunit 2